MKPAAEWDWIPIVVTVVAVAIAVLISIAAAYAIGASVQLCPRELAVWSERIYEARRFKATANVADAPLLPLPPIRMPGNSFFSELWMRHDR